MRSVAGRFATGHRRSTGGADGRRWLAIVLGLIGLLVVGAGCGSSWDLPDRDDQAVRAREQELGATLTSSSEGAAVCEVRLLGQADGASFVWAECRATPANGSWATSGPLRMEGDHQEGPGDGNRYADDVRRLFPSGLADRILRADSDLRP